MTTINSIIDMLVKGGLNEAEAFEVAEVEDIIAERAYIDYEAEEARDAEERAYWARIEEEERAYYERNYKPFQAWAEEHIYNKCYDEITPEDYSLFSDWHKDLFGVRPHYYLSNLKEREAKEYILNEGWIIDDHKDKYGWTMDDLFGGF